MLSLINFYVPYPHFPPAVCEQQDPKHELKATNERQFTRIGILSNGDLSMLVPYPLNSNARQNRSGLRT